MQVWECGLAWSFRTRISTTTTGDKLKNGLTTHQLQGNCFKPLSGALQNSESWTITISMRGACTYWHYCFVTLALTGKQYRFCFYW